MKIPSNRTGNSEIFLWILPRAVHNPREKKKKKKKKRLEIACHWYCTEAFHSSKSEDPGDLHIVYGLFDPTLAVQQTEVISICIARSYVIHVHKTDPDGYRRVKPILVSKLS